MTHPFLDRLARGPVLCDGATGTQLYAGGIAFDHCFEALNLSEPRLVADIHRAYIDAGAEIIETNTYGANRYKLEQFGLADQVRAINAKALRIAKDIRDIAGQPTFIAGAVGPLGVVLEPFGPVRPADAQAAFAEQIGALLEQGADLLMFETFGDLRELELAIAAARAISDLPLVAQMSFAEDGRTIFGQTPEEVVSTLYALGADVIGVNCSVGPQRVFKVLEAMHLAEPRARLAAQPNAGWPTEQNHRIFYPSTPEYMARYARRMVEELGVSIVGGCCGTTPAHIAAMRAALVDLRPDAPAEHVHITFKPEPPKRTAAVAPPTKLAAALANNEFVVCVEIDPPKGHNPRKCLEGALMLKEHGVNFINVADSPMARVRMGPLALCTLIQQQTGLESIIHFTTRDRSLMGLQSDLLGAHALDVRNVLTLKGDPPALGKYPGTSGVFDVDTLGLVKIAVGMNEGRDTLGDDIGTPTNFLIGVPLNHNAEDRAAEIEKLRLRIAAGAHFIMTQVAYDAGELQEFLSALGPCPLPIIAGILPLQSYRQAEFLRNEVPGISPTPDVMRRMQLAGPEGRKEGVRLARELVGEIKGLVQGIYVMPSFQRYEVAAEVIAAL